MNVYVVIGSGFVIGIIALLMSILMPSLSAARAHTKTVVCGSNLNHIGKAVANYLFVSRGVYPASYLYPDDEKGNWTIQTQEASHPHGYVHWSYFLYDNGNVGDNAFQCPSMDRGGAPRCPGAGPRSRPHARASPSSGGGRVRG